MSKKRKQYSPEENVSILRRHLLDGVPVSHLCDAHGIHLTMFYKWQKVFFEQGASAFAPKQSVQEKQQARKIAVLEAKLATKNEVLSELMEEHILKKVLGRPESASGFEDHSRVVIDFVVHK